MMKFTNAQKIIVIIILGILLLGIVADLAITGAEAHESPDTFLTRLVTLTGIITTVATGLGAYFKSKNTATEVTALKADVATVKAQTNGPIAAQGVLLAAVHDAVVDGNTAAAAANTIAVATATPVPPAVRPGMSPVEADRAAGAGG